MEQWLGVYRKLTGASAEDDTEQGEQGQLLRTLRHTIEHLSDARLTEAVARRDPANTKWKKPNIDKLPGSELFLGFEPGNHEYVFGLVDVKALFEEARQHANVDTPPELLNFEPSDSDWEHMFRDYGDEP